MTGSGIALTAIRVAKSKYANWYSDRRWRKIRAIHLAKEPLCRFCQKEGRLTPADVVDHVIPHKGDRHIFWYGERMSLCHSCHSSTKQIIESQGPSRLERRADPDSHWSR